MKKRLEHRNVRIFTLLSILLLLLVAGVAGTYLYDEEISTSNSLRVATFDLKVNGKDNPGTLVSFSNILPGESFSTTIPVRIVGGREGKVSLTFTNIKFDEETLTEPESKYETTDTAPLWEKFYVSVNGGSRSTLKEGLTKTIGILKPNETTYVVVRFDAKTTLADNFQGDGIYFDMVFKAEQQ